ncbi:hypothetical protein AVEN_255412-1 [Araneus ventricosus]|uniref:Uncharacterized protein n=1 Tax=Araneus ventricosus TaxID=182803 RepID=A0A4Y2IXG0_ARAVE|nr:hypothetical protein AVEN_255412-1 [Araneus ventricosus]
MNGIIALENSFSRAKSLVVALRQEEMDSQVPVALLFFSPGCIIRSCFSQNEESLAPVSFPQGSRKSDYKLFAVAVYNLLWGQQMRGGLDSNSSNTGLTQCILIRNGNNFSAF